MRRVFTNPVLDVVTEQVKQSERNHGGEIRVVIEADISTQALLRDQSTRERAIEVFASMHVWDTLARNGVLIYLCLADRAVEIVADRGFDGKVTAAQWQGIMESLQRECAQRRYQQALCDAIRSVSNLIAVHYPTSDRNELPDRPVLL